LSLQDIDYYKDNSVVSAAMTPGAILIESGGKADTARELCG
jgi:hypothetical protein